MRTKRITLRQPLILYFHRGVMLALMSLIWLGSAAADERGLVRIGQHSDFIRIVIESSSEVEFRSTLSTDGLAATITVPGLAGVAPLPQVLPPIETMRASYDRAHRSMTLSLHFAAPVRLVDTLHVPPSGRIGYRLALDYAQLTATPPAAAAPVAAVPPATQPSLPAIAAAPAAVPAVAPDRAAPPPGLGKVTPQAGPPQAANTNAADAPSLASVLGAVQFGRGEDQTVEAIAAQFGAQVSPLRAATRNSTGERRLFVSFFAPIVTLGRAHATYQFDPQSQALIEVQFDWGDSFGDGLTADQRDALTRQLLGALSADGFQRAGAIIGASAPSNGWLVYSGADSADRRTQIWAIPALRNDATSGDPRFMLRLIFAPSATPSP